MLRLFIFVTGYLALCIHGYAVLTLTISENLISGGTNWQFSEASGTLSSQSSSHFLVGSTAANPQNFYASDAQDHSLTVLAGNNALGIQSIFTRNLRRTLGLQRRDIRWIGFPDRRDYRRPVSIRHEWPRSPCRSIFILELK